VTDVQLLDLEEIRKEIQVRQTQEHQDHAQEVERVYQYVKPLTLAADGLIEAMTNVDGRFMTGIPELDLMTRGLGTGDLAMFCGRAGSGKTQILLNAIVNNPLAHVVMFSPDEVSELILAKLTSIKYGINAEEIERKIKQGDDDTTRLVRRAASHDFRNLIVFDESLTLRQCTDALKEAQDYWQAEADLAIFDYLELIPINGVEGAEGVAAKAQAMKRWTRSAAVPVAVVHQSSRSSGSRGQAAGMNGMRYGGEAEATFVIEAFRKREDDSLDPFERRRHQHTLSINLAKNKRPPSKLGCFDVHLDPNTGSIRTLRDDDSLTVGMPLQSAEQAMKVAMR
jgi:replicative DNA helicase